jgi:hypothetical protein
MCQPGATIIFSTAIGLLQYVSKHSACSFLMTFVPPLFAGVNHDVEQLESITDNMKELLFDCARNSRWISDIVAQHSTIFDRWDRLPEVDFFTPEVRDRLKQIMSDRHRLREFADRVPDEAKAAVRELDEQMRTLRTAGRTDGDMGSTARFTGLLP